jgi:type VI protein secretion system component VasF
MGFFKTAKPKQFAYRPRYYDQKKEELEKRKRELEKSGEGDSAHLRMEIQRRWRFVDRKNSSRSKQVKILFYLLLLAILAFYIFFV